MGFTAAVSHELRTPLARLLALLESALLPGADQQRLLEQAQAEVKQAGELIDDVLFLSELETGREVVSLGSTRALPVLEEAVHEVRERADRAGVVVGLHDAGEHIHGHAADVADAQAAALKRRSDLGRSKEPRPLVRADRQ